MNQRFLEHKLAMWTPTVMAATIQKECARQPCTTYSPTGATLRTQTFIGTFAAQFATGLVLRNCTRTRCSTQKIERSIRNPKCDMTSEFKILLQVEARV